VCPARSEFLIGVKTLDPAAFTASVSGALFPKDVGVAVVTTVGLRLPSVTTATFHSDPD
jgi:hypothetical protein